LTKIAAISGSLRAGSSNTAALRAAARLVPEGVEVVLFDGIAALPFFNPDLDGDEVPAPVGVMRRLIASADGILISSPEYARGVAGVLKNALDWLVGSREFPGMPVALINTSPRATQALAALTLILETMSARIATEALRDPSPARQRLRRVQHHRRSRARRSSARGDGKLRHLRKVDPGGNDLTPDRPTWKNHRMALLFLSGQGRPLATDFPYRGQWLIENRWFLYAVDAQELGADQDVVTVGPLTGFNACMPAAKLGLTIERLFEADRLGRLTLDHVD
jgi:chromate reductase, NAD(P)H dehydrogenase (quinone)